MTSVAAKRLFMEYKNLTKDSPEGITAGPVNEDDMYIWEALIEGPDGTPFEGGVFPAELKFPKDYPLMPPTMRFLCDVWHPNGEPSQAVSCHMLPARERVCCAKTNMKSSLSQRHSLHIDPPSTRRRPKRLRTRIRTLVAHSECREDLDQCHEYASGAQ